MKRSPHSSAKHRSRLAFTLIEIAIVLGIIGLITGAIFVAYSGVGNANRLRLGTQELTSIANGVRSIFVERGTIQGDEADLTLAMDKMQIFPAEMRTNTLGVLYNPWSPSINGSVGSASVNNGSSAAGCNFSPSASTSPTTCFAVTFYNVPASACIQLVVQTSQTQFSNNLLGINVNGNSAASSGSPTYAANMPYSLSAATTACGNTTNNISWFYNLK